MQGSALAVLEKPLQMLAPRLELVLDKRVPVQRLIQTIMISVERLPKLLECDLQSLLNSAMTAAVLGLEVDGVTGQAYLIPFKGKAQLVVGYKGYNTIAARSGITITGEVVRDGDAFDYDLAEGWITHKPKLHGRGDIIAAWAKADAKDRPPIIKVMGRDELLAVKAKSPGGQRSDSPWNDAQIGFPAMCEKTVKRRLARSLPLNTMQYAARMDEAVEEQGAPTWISPDRGAIVDGEIIEREPSPTPTVAQLIGDGRGGADLAAPQVSGSSPPAPPTHGEPETESERIASLDAELDTAAKLGTPSLVEAWNKLSDDDAAVLRVALNKRHKPTARAADEAKGA